MMWGEGNRKNVRFGEREAEKLERRIGSLTGGWEKAEKGGILKVPRSMFPRQLLRHKFKILFLNDCV